MSTLPSSSSPEMGRGIQASFAENAAGEMVHVSEVPLGLECDCRCPGCGSQMIAKQGEIRSWHFAHYSSASCVSMTWLHRSAQDVLAEQRRITLPINEGGTAVRCLEFSNVVLEVAVGSRRVDCLCVMEDGHEFAVEIRVTHEVDDDKLDELRSADPTRDIVEIDLSSFRGRSLNWQELTKAVCDSPQHIKWLYRTGPQRNSVVSKQAVATTGYDRRTGLARLRKLMSRLRMEPARSGPRRSRRRRPPGYGRRTRG